MRYGSVNADSSAASSSVTIPAGLPDGVYTLSLYSEDWNGETFTDYATGTPFNETIIVGTVTPDVPVSSNTATSGAVHTIGASSGDSGEINPDTGAEISFLYWFFKNVMYQSGK